MVSSTKDSKLLAIPINYLYPKCKTAIVIGSRKMKPSSSRYN